LVELGRSPHLFEPIRPPVVQLHGVLRRL
jgi:hypothetical protein